MSNPKITLAVSNMNCGPCVARVETLLKIIPRVTGADVNLAAETAAVSGEVDLQTVVKTLAATNYPTSTQTLSYNVEGMSCASCVARVENAVVAIPGVVNASVNFASESADVSTITGAVSKESVRSAIEDAGYRIVETTSSLERTGKSCIRW